MRNFPSATFTITSAGQGTVLVDGNLFRTIPHGSATPLSSQFAFDFGGRWNSPGSYPVLYTSSSVTGARNYVNWQADHAGLPLDAWAPENQPDLLIISVTASFADLATDYGLVNRGLPPTYPVGYLGSDSWTITQTIAATLYMANWPGLVTRSATAPSWTGPITEWAEVAVFSDRAGPPTLVDRVAYKDWYWN